MSIVVTHCRIMYSTLYKVLVGIQRKSHYYKIYKREKDDVSLDKFAAVVVALSPLCYGVNSNGERDK